MNPASPTLDTVGLAGAGLSMVVIGTVVVSHGARWMGVLLIVIGVTLTIRACLKD